MVVVVILVRELILFSPAALVGRRARQRLAGRRHRPANEQRRRCIRTTGRARCEGLVTQGLVCVHSVSIISDFARLRRTLHLVRGQTRGLQALGLTRIRTIATFTGRARIFDGGASEARGRGFESLPPLSFSRLGKPPSEYSGLSSRTSSAGRQARGLGHLAKDQHCLPQSLLARL